MNGRTATARPPARATDAATVSLRRRMALAVSRRFGGASRTSAQPVAPPAQKANAADPESGFLALDQRVRETGEW